MEPSRTLHLSLPQHLLLHPILMVIRPLCLSSLVLLLANQQILQLGQYVLTLVLASLTRSQPCHGRSDLPGFFLLALLQLFLLLVSS